MQHDELPDTSAWQPSERATETFRSAFKKRCQSVETMICSRALAERSFNENNFDAGQGIEDIVRSEFTNILPTRYKVRCGSIIDRHGRTAGDVDFIVFNEQWFPVVKYGATAESRRFCFPIEGVYVVGEVKQTLSRKSLDDAMKKLVICHRLHRPPTKARRLVENRESSSCTHGFSNPLYSFILATDLESGEDLEDLIHRFIVINKSLKRREVIRGLCVLNHGTVAWGFYDESTDEVRPAQFMMEDLYQPIMPGYRSSQNSPALYSLMMDLFHHLYHSVLAAEDIAVAYGFDNERVLTPASGEFHLPPDKEDLESLNHFCPEEEVGDEEVPPFATHVWNPWR